LFIDKPAGEVNQRDDDTLVFELKVACKKNPQAPADPNADPKDLFINSSGTVKC